MSKRPVGRPRGSASAGNRKPEPKPVPFNLDSANGGNLDNVDSGAVVFDPTTFDGGSIEPVGSPETGSNGETGEIKRGRGRPPGSRNGAGTKAKAAPLNISGVEKVLLGIHTTLQAAFSIPELELSKEEASEMAKAYSDVAVFYPKLLLSDQVAATFNLLSVTAIVYGSRISAWRFRKSMERKQPPPPRPDAALRAAPPAPSPGEAPREQPRKVPDEARVGEIPGVGNIVFPADHELMGGKKH